MHVCHGLLPQRRRCRAKGASTSPVCDCTSSARTCRLLHTCRSGPGRCHLLPVHCICLPKGLPPSLPVSETLATEEPAHGKPIRPPTATADTLKRTPSLGVFGHRLRGCPPSMLQVSLHEKKEIRAALLECTSMGLRLPSKQTANGGMAALNATYLRAHQVAHRHQGRATLCPQYLFNGAEAGQHLERERILDASRVALGKRGIRYGVALKTRAVRVIQGGDKALMDARVYLYSALAPTSVTRSC